MPKREPGSSSGSSPERNGMDRPPQAVADRRALRSRYSTVKTIIHDERENITQPDSNKFDSIFNEMESLHELVQNPREQVADAEALLGIANTLMTSVNAHRNEGITPTDFINCLIRYFGKPNGSINWNELGKEVSHIFQTPPKCCTMIGPMDVGAKQRKSYVRRKRVNPSENDTPEELEDAAVEVETETVKNVATMFNILRKVRRVRLENLILNRVSFAQTVENLFALSFLVKDGRAEIKVNEEGHHLVAPRNAPSASAITSGEVTHCHFVFRLDFKDWKLMKDYVGDGEQLMPHRVSQVDIRSNSQFYQQCEEPQVTATSTPIRKFTRNRGLVLQEHPVGGGVAGSNQPIVEDSPVCNYMDEDEALHTTDEDRAAVIRKGKRKML